MEPQLAMFSQPWWAALGAIVLIDLDEGVRMMSRIEDADAEAVHIGMPVKARIIAREDEHLVVFVPAAEAAR